jgi:hypothetical protein
MFQDYIHRRFPISERLFRRVLIKYFARSLIFDLQLLAKQETVAYIRAHMPDALIVRDRWALLKLGLERRKIDGLVLELGVEKGRSIQWIARHHRGIVHGFDSFEGLPGDWAGAFERKGSFSTSGRLPKVPKNVALHPGWFSESLPAFLQKHKGPAAFIHIDCDIYDSTKAVFTLLADRIVPGTIIVFDEYFNYPNWRQHEFKGFQEFVKEHNVEYQYVAFAEKNGHVMIKILGVRADDAC